MAERIKQHTLNVSALCSTPTNAHGPRIHRYHQGHALFKKIQYNNKDQ